MNRRKWLWFMAAAIPVAAVGGITASATGDSYSTSKAQSWWKFRDQIGVTRKWIDFDGVEGTI